MFKRTIIILSSKDADNTGEVNLLSEYTIVILFGQESDYINKYDNIPLYIRGDLDILILYIKVREESQKSDINYYFF